MPELQWDSQEFLEVLGEPSHLEEYGCSYSYSLARDGLSLLLTLWPYESVVHLSLYREGDERPIIGFALVIRGGVRRRREKWGEWLEFSDCVIVPDCFYYLKAEGAFDTVAPGLAVELAVTPDLRIDIGYQT